MGGPRLLRPRPQPACLRPGRGGARRRFPRDVEGLRALPGIGAYTAAAVAAIAFDAPVVPVDGNVERVAARVFADGGRRCPARSRAWPRWRRASWPTRRRAPGPATSPRRCSTSAPRSARRARRPARCAPGATACAAQARGHRRRRCRARRRSARGRCATARISCCTTPRGGCCCAAARRRGCSAGCWRCRARPGARHAWDEAEALAHAPLAGLRWRRVPGVARHGFTHFELEMVLFAAHGARGSPPPRDGGASACRGGGSGAAER